MTVDWLKEHKIQYDKLILTNAYDSLELAKKDNMKNIQILTDELCNYYIYEKMGCKKIYENIIEYKEYDTGNVMTKKVFIYEKKLQ